MKKLTFPPEEFPDEMFTDIEKIINYKIKNKQLFREALTHRSIIQH